MATKCNAHKLDQFYPPQPSFHDAHPLYPIKYTTGWHEITGYTLYNLMSQSLCEVSGHLSCASKHTWSNKPV